MSRGRLAALTIAGAALIVLAAIGLGYQSKSDLHRFLAIAALQAAVYLTAVRLAWRGGSSQLVVLGIAAVAVLMRVPVALAPPYLSSDIYRYVWDGRIEAAGFNPYTHTPVDPRLVELRDQDIFPQIASKQAPTIYPPVAETIFLAVTRVSESVTAMKVTMVAFEAVTFAFLARLLAIEGLPSTRVIVYAWHPLPLWEFAGSGHIDAVLIAFCAGALWAARRGRDGLAGLFLAGATLTKFYPVVLLPALYRRWDWKLPAAFALAIIIGYLPFITAGSQVLGFLPGYAGQEGLDADGTGFYLLSVLRLLLPPAALSARAYIIGAGALLAVLGIALIFRRYGTRPSIAAAGALATVFMVLVSPHYSWYFAWFILFAGFVQSFALLWLTNACMLLYLSAGYLFVHNDQRLAIESIIYGPFAALALVDLWRRRRQAIPRS
jgi:alpha-1,6-mannosyltransferase